MYYFKYMHINSSIHIYIILKIYKHLTGLMGIGWILSDENSNNHLFKGQTSNFVSSTRAEIMAIATLLSTLPRDSTITIFSDSQAAIHAIENFTTTKSKSKSRKYKNWIILEYITETI